MNQRMTKPTVSLLRPAKTDQPAHPRSLIRVIADRLETISKTLGVGFGLNLVFLMLFVRLFDLRLFGFVCFLFLLVSEKGCGF